MWFGVLGPLEVRARSGDLVELGPPQRRMVLAVLLAETGLVVSTDRIMQAIWGEDTDPSHITSLQAHVSRLRTILGSGRIVTRRPGYILETSGAEIDAAQAESLAREGRASAANRDWQAAEEQFRSGLGLWRGRPYQEFIDHQYFEWEIARLEELRLEVSEDLAAVELETGSNIEVISRLEPLMRAYPLRERLRALLMVALYRTGRQTDALVVYRDLRTHLAEELGLVPSQELDELEVRILNHDPALAATNPKAATVATTVQRKPMSAPSASLLVDGEWLPLTRAVTTIGRQPDRDVVVNDDETSRRHAEIRSLPQGHLLIDIGSTNGTQVNGQQVVEHHLKPGDIITIGATAIVYGRL